MLAGTRRTQGIEIESLLFDAYAKLDRLHRPGLPNGPGEILQIVGGVEIEALNLAGAKQLIGR